jgi:hypothetical protein
VEKAFSEALNKAFEHRATHNTMLQCIMDLLGQSVGLGLFSAEAVAKPLELCRSTLANQRLSGRLEIIGFKRNFLNCFGIGMASEDWLKNDLKVLQQYINGSVRVVECRNAALSVSADAWDRVTKSIINV